ncbi:hypothetical protein L0Y49_04250 [bacterium]|nr:hypothetical protein [bacterium]
MMREDMPPQKKLDLNSYIQIMAQTLRSTLDAARRRAETARKNAAGGKYGEVPRTPDVVLAVLASPWYVAETRKLTVGQDTPFMFTESILNKSIEEEIRRFTMEEFQKYEKISKDVEIIETNPMQIRLNGYNVPAPFGKKTKMAEIFFHTSFTSKRILDKIRQEIESAFNTHKVEFHTFILHAYTFIRDFIAVKGEEFTFIDISGDVTDISIAENDILKRTITFPVGKNYCVRELSSVLGTDTEETLSLFSLYRAQKLSTEERGKMDAALKRVKEHWLAALHDAVSRGPEPSSFPSKIFVAADSVFADWFIEVVQEEEFHQYQNAGRSFDVIPFNAFWIKEFCKPPVTREKNNPSPPAKDSDAAVRQKGAPEEPLLLSGTPLEDDPLLAVEAIFANKMFDFESTHAHEDKQLAFKNGY